MTYIALIDEDGDVSLYECSGKLPPMVLMHQHLAALYVRINPYTDVYEQTAKRINSDVNTGNIVFYQQANQVDILENVCYEFVGSSKKEDRPSTPRPAA